MLGTDNTQLTAPDTPENYILIPWIDDWFVPVTKGTRDPLWNREYGTNVYRYSPYYGDIPFRNGEEFFVLDEVDIYFVAIDEFLMFSRTNKYKDS